MADQKITALTANTDPQSGDLILVVDDPSGSAEDKKITIGEFMATRNLYATYTPPAIGDFAWVNQGIATATSGSWGINIVSILLAGDNFRILKKSSPATPYSIVICMIPRLHEYNTQSAGVCFRESSSGSFVFFGVETANNITQITATKWTDVTTISADYKKQNIVSNMGRIFLKIEDDGTDRVCSWGRDGVNFLEFHSVGRTDFITADEVGMALNVDHGTYGCSATYISWTEA